MDLPIYVIHCKTGLEERRRSIESQLGQFGLTFEFILEHDRDELDPKVCQKYFSQSYPNNLISLSLKHREGMRRLVASGHKTGLILEDDVILCPDFPIQLEKVLKESNHLAFPHVIYLSNYGNRYTPRSKLKKNKLIYENNQSRACDSYLITANACANRLDWWEKNIFSLPIDHQVNVIDPSVGIKIFWAEPTLIEQGSENGTFNSSIGTPHQQWFKWAKWNIDKFYKKHILRNLR